MQAFHVFILMQSHLLFKYKDFLLKIGLKFMQCIINLVKYFKPHSATQELPT